MHSAGGSSVTWLPRTKNFPALMGGVRRLTSATQSVAGSGATETRDASRPVAARGDRETEPQRAFLGSRRAHGTQRPAADRFVADPGNRALPGGILQRGLEHAQRRVIVADMGEGEFDAPTPGVRLRRVRQSFP